MNFLITGCFGFIGFNFLQDLLKQMSNTSKVYGIDSLENLCSINNKNIAEKFSNFIFYKADINNIDDLGIKDIDVIVNFAAESHVDNSIYNPAAFIDANIRGTTKLLNYAMKNNIENFVHISTDEVYGSKLKGYCYEDDIFKPSSPYSASKASAELIINSYERTYGYKVSVVRPANNYGIYQQPEKLIPFSIAKLETNENIEIYGDGLNVRHWLHVSDTCSAIMKVMNEGKQGEVYNIGSDYYLPNVEVAKKLLNILKLDNTRMVYVEDRPGHDFRYAVNIDKLKHLGWIPKSNFDEELEKIVAWYIENKNWWLSQYEKIVSSKRNKRMGLV